VAKRTPDDWIYAARRKLYKATKNMTIPERLAYINKLTDPIIERYGLKVVSVDDVREGRA
jgi:hypothetical protein